MINNEITVVVCNYNSEQFIKETILAILNQTQTNFNILIIDDYSTDRSLSIIEELLSKTKISYRIISQRENTGIASVRQKALETAKSKYIIYIDSDDIVHPSLIEKLHNYIKTDSKIIGVNCWSKFIDVNNNKVRGGLFIGARSKADYISKAKREKLFFMPIQCLFVREEALKAGGFSLLGFPSGKPRYQDYCEDLDLWTRMSDLHKEDKYMITIPEVLYSYRKTGLGLSSNRLYMMLKMRFVKINLKRRRRGENELSFIDFLNSYSKQDIAKLEKEAEVATLLGNGAFLFNSGRKLEGLKQVLLSFTKDPSYLWQKLLANTRIFK